MAGAGAREGKQERAVRRINRRFWQFATHPDDQEFYRIDAVATR